MDSAPRQGAFRVGFLGSGIISSGHAEALKFIPQGHLAAVCDVLPGRAQAVAAQHGIPEVYSSAEEMLRAARLDVVHILTPPQYHIALALDCVRAGCHVLVEKPLGLAAEDCARLVEEGRRRGVVCAVNHNTTHFPVIERLIAAIRGRRLGRINHASYTYNVPPEHVPVSDLGNYMFQAPENMIFEFGPHPFSVIRLLMGSCLAAETVAAGETALANGKRYWNSWQIAAVCERGTAGLYLGVGAGLWDVRLQVFGEDAVAEADLRRGTLLFTEPSPRRIAGPLGSAIVDGIEILGGVAGGLAQQYGAALSLRGARLRDPFVRSLASFYAALAAGKSPREDASAGQAVVEFCEAAARQIRFAPARAGELASVANR